MADLNIGGMKVNRNMLIVSGAVAGGIVFYAYMRRKNQPTDTTSTANTTDTSADSSIDPSTDLPWSDEMNSGNYGAYPVGVTDPNSGYQYWVANQTVTSVSTNGQWAQAAEAYLEGIGYDAATVAAALGKALQSRPLNTAELAIYDAAVAFEGNPPVPVTIVQASTSTSGTGTTTGTATSKPGWAYGAHVTSKNRTSVRVDWNDVSGVTGYHLTKNGALITSVATSVFTFSGLKPNTKYTFGITPYNSKGNGPTSHITATTSK